jgi:hypothetical protein
MVVTVVVTVVVTTTPEDQVEHKRSEEVRCLHSILCYRGFNVVKSWNGKKDLLIQINYMVSVTKQSYAKMLIT